MAVDLSIIIPVYNGEKTIGKLLLSLIQNNNVNFEIIVIDDGSVDDSLCVCKKISKIDSRIRVFTQPNAGVSTARNQGIRQANGRYVGFIDCDDSIKTYMYEKMLKIAQNTKCDMVMGGYEKVNYKSNEKILVELPFAGLIEKKKIREVIFQMVFWDAFYDNTYHKTIYGSVWPNLYRKDIIVNNNIVFPTEVSLGEDLLFNVKYLSSINNVYFINEPMYEYNVTDDSATRGRKRDILEKYFLLMEKVHNLLGENYKNDLAYKYNFQRQYINFAISAIQEQVCASNMLMKEKVWIIKNIMLNKKIKDASKYMFTKGKTIKDKIIGFLFFSRMKKLVYCWLNKE